MLKLKFSPHSNGIFCRVLQSANNKRLSQHVEGLFFCSPGAGDAAKLVYYPQDRAATWSKPIAFQVLVSLLVTFTTKAADEMRQR